MLSKIFAGYNKDNFKTAIGMAWPAIVESFFVAFAGLVDSFMVSRLGSYAVAAVGLTTQPKFVGLAMFFAVNVSISALVARRYGEEGCQHHISYSYEVCYNRSHSYKCDISPCS